MPTNTKVPTPTLERLATYLTVLNGLRDRQVQTVSSSEIEKHTGINAAQFRKDLSYFGEFGRPGIGYDVGDLRARISRILKLEKVQRVLLVGAGNLGAALAGYPTLKAENFQIVAVFDNSPSKVGKQLWHLTVRDIDDVVEVNRRLRARIGIIAVPAIAAQDVADALIRANVLTVLNFAPVQLRLPPQVTVRNVDFVQELAVLSYHLPEER